MLKLLVLLLLDLSCLGLFVRMLKPCFSVLVCFFCDGFYWFIACNKGGIIRRSGHRFLKFSILF
ncbi:hypothetical protein MANES_08G050100v8 [Manihot esculenta]|uniref:Uncharacterized protein n=1 Tax=Manihot esculenta TaxID=3983 RepID=A0A2C9VDJ8_MANES|nr:hypothetical protein MANES_08G050100v8 [Manihot esculenta]